MSWFGKAGFALDRAIGMMAPSLALRRMSDRERMESLVRQSQLRRRQAGPVRQRLDSGKSERTRPTGCTETG